METKTLQEMAAACGLSTKDLTGRFDWDLTLQPDWVATELAYAPGPDGNATLIPVRVRNVKTSEIFSKLPDENFDPATVDKMYAVSIDAGKGIAEIQRKIFAAHPETDPGKEDSTISVNLKASLDADQKLQIDVSDLPADIKETAEQAIAEAADVSVKP